MRSMERKLNSVFAAQTSTPNTKGNDHMSPPSEHVRKMQFITRMPDKLWRVWVTFNGTDFGQVYFSDKTCGSEGASLEAAQKHRDAVVAENKIPLRVYAGDGYYVQHAKSHSQLGGVTLVADDTERPTRVNWSAHIMRNGKPGRRSFSIRLYGYAAAYLKAARVRVAHTGQEIPPVPAPPPWVVAWAATYGVNLDMTESLPQ